MDRKIFIVIAAVGVLIICSTIAVFAFSGGEKKKAPTMPLLTSFPDETVDLSVSQVMIDEGSDMYFPIGSPGANVTLVYSVRVTLTWSDDEQPPAWRVTYANEPDTFTATTLMMAAGAEGGANGTMNMTSSSSSGTLSLDLTPSGDPGYIMGKGGAEWTIPLAGTGGINANDTVYVKVGVAAGDIRGQGPHLLMYNDFGDEIDMTVTVRYKSIPLDVYDYYFVNAAPEV
jgi:hypothetical protein